MSSAATRATIWERLTVSIVWAALVTAGDAGLHALGVLDLNWGSFAVFGACGYFFGTGWNDRA